MNVYDRIVPYVEYKKAPPPAPHDLAILAILWGAALRVGVPVFECFEVLGTVTSNARLRRLLADAWSRVRGQSIVNAFHCASDEIDPRFITDVRDGEIEGRLDKWLFAYATFNGVFGKGLIASHIGWSDSVQHFTAALAEALGQEGGSLIRFLRVQYSSTQYTPGFGTTLENLSAAIEGGATFSEALQNHAGFFGDYYLAMVCAGEQNHCLHRALEFMSPNNVIAETKPL